VAGEGGNEREAGGPNGNGNGEKPFYLIVSAYGFDRPGLVASIADAISSCGLNIVDVRQNSLKGVFSMSLVCESALRRAQDAEGEVKDRLRDLDLKFNVHLTRYRPDDQKRLVVFTIVGKDRLGLLRDITRKLAAHRINIERINHLARKDFVVLEMLLDATQCPDLGEVREDVRIEGVDVILQEYDVYKRRKRVVVFDLDSTLVQGELIDELARHSRQDVAPITAAAMRGEIDFGESLRRRVALLAGLEEGTLKAVASQATMSPGAEELIRALRDLGFRIALISGSFTQVVETIKERLGLDYAFGNRLEVKDGRLTGRVIEPIVDAKAKGELLREIARREGVDPKEIIAVGDGANDVYMITSAGLGISFNGKELLKRAAQGEIEHSTLYSIIYCLGIER
jgi:phosphoserine phosphatase